MSTDHTDTLPRISQIERRAKPRNAADQPNHSIWRGPLNEAPDSLEIAIEAEIGGYDPYDTKY